MSKKRPVSFLALILGSFTFAWILYFAVPGIAETWKLQFNDYLFRIRYRLFGKRPSSPSVVHVDFDDETARLLEAGYADKVLYSQIISVLAETYVSTIAFDMLFTPGSDRAVDDNLAEVTYESGNVYFPVIVKPFLQQSPTSALKVDVEATKILWYPQVLKQNGEIKAKVVFSIGSELTNAAKGIGHITCYPDRDGVFRRFPLLIKVGDGFVPSLSFRLVCDYLGVMPETVEVSFGHTIRLPSAQFPDGREKDIVIPIDSQGRIIINFAGPWEDSFFHYPVSTILRAQKDSNLLDSLTDELEGNLVVVSDVSTASRDIGPTPLESLYPLSGLHVNIISSILKQDFIDELSFWQEILISLLLGGVLLLLASKFRGIAFTASALGMLVLFLIVLAFAFFYLNTLSNLVSPALAILLSVIAISLYKYLLEEKEKAFIRATFENYFAPEVISKILRAPQLLNVVEHKELTVLFSDIAGFTSWCSNQSPERVRQTLNLYYEEMAKIVFAYGGTINKFIGDGLMVIFGDPIQQVDHELRAARAAINMQLKTRELRRQWEKEGGLPIQIRIGINAGQVVVGNMGSSSRLDYTAIGSNVNLAQRLESAAPLGGILVSKKVHEKVKEDLKAKSVGSIQVKGLSDKIDVFEIVVPKDAGQPP